MTTSTFSTILLFYPYVVGIVKYYSKLPSVLVTFKGNHIQSISSLPISFFADHKPPMASKSFELYTQQIDSTIPSSQPPHIPTTYECVGMIVCAFVATASSLRHRLVTVLVCV
jgi:hypothetical protein